ITAVEESGIEQKGEYRLAHAVRFLERRCGEAYLPSHDTAATRYECALDLALDRVGFRQRELRHVRGDRSCGLVIETSVEEPLDGGSGGHAHGGAPPTGTAGASSSASSVGLPSALLSPERALAVPVSRAKWRASSCAVRSGRPRLPAQPGPTRSPRSRRRSLHSAPDSNERGTFRGRGEP